MKVEKIRLKNLASLEGEWELDLTGPAYSRNGIFAITGATGAGKTTIFDAIRLALFRRTNRLDSFAGENEIMTRGTAECMARIQFSIPGGRYVATWHQTRSRGRADGRLQPDRHTLERMKPDGSLELLAERRKETEKAIRALIGMDFEHFSRAMLLPQGEFAIFLKTPPAERSDILEQITGSTVYKQISAEAYAKYHLMQEELDRLTAGAEAIRLLPDEERDALAAQRAGLSKEAAGLAARAGELERAVDLAGRLAGLRTERSKLAAELEAAEPELETAAAAAGEAKKHYDDAAGRQAAVRPAIAAARLLDAALLRGEEELRKLADARRAGETAKREADRELELLRQKISGTESELATVTAYFEARPEENLRLERYPVWLDRLKASENNQSLLRKELRQVREAETALAGLAQRRDPQQKRLAQTEAGLEQLRAEREQLGGNADAGAGTVLQLTVRKLKLEELSRLAAEQAERLRQLDETARRKNELAAEQEQIAPARAALETELAGLDAENRIPNLAAERAALREGSPCPLCGATHHPHAGIPAPTASRARAEAIRTNLQEQQIRLAAISGELRSLDEQTVRLRTAAAAAAERLRTECGSSDPAEFAGKLSEQLQRCADELEAAQRLQNERTRLENAFRKLEIEKQKNRDELITAEHETALAEQQLAALRRQFEETRRRQKESLDELRAEFTRFHLSWNDLSQLSDAVAAVEEMFRRSRDMQERASGAASRLREEQNEFQLRSGFREERIRRLAETAAEHEKKETELLALRQERAAMLDGLPADRAERQHETAVAAARRAFEEAEAGLQRKRELHTVLRTRFEETTRRLTAAEAELAALPADSRLPEEKSAEAAGLREKARRLDEEAGALGQKLESDREARGRRQAEEAKIGAFRSEVERWRLLNELIGKQDGGKFQQFAQSLIFEQLIALANRSLRKFTDRYRLVSIEDSPLDFNVIDHYQCDEIRSVRNLSGGESFLVSMSLALALSQTAGEKLRIDTLFLDEGFGTLDEETLSHVLAQIQSLQSEGKLIGIITHVPNIETFVPLQIRLAPAERSGRSRITGPGVSALS